MRLIDIIIALCWISFWVYWIIAAFSSKKDTTPSNMRVFVGSRIGLLVLALLVATLFHQLPQTVTNHSLGTSRPVQLIGLIIFLIGFSLAIWARVHLGKYWGMPMTEKLKPKLVRSGPYRRIRHPIYSGMLFMIIGSAIDVNAYWAIVFIVAAVYFTYSAVVEERNMRQQFPKDYQAYKRTTKMLLPYIF